MEVFEKILGGGNVNSTKMLCYDAQKKFVDELMSVRGADVKYDMICTPFVETPDTKNSIITWLSDEILQKAYADSYYANSDYFVVMVSLKEQYQMSVETMNFLRESTKRGTLQMVIYSDGVENKNGGATQHTDVECYFVFSHKQNNDRVRFCYISFQSFAEIDVQLLSRKIGWGNVNDTVNNEFVIGQGRYLDIKYSDIAENEYIINPHFYFLQDAELLNMSEEDTCITIKELLSVNISNFRKVNLSELKKVTSKNFFSNRIGEVLSFKPFDSDDLKETNYNNDSVNAYLVPSSSVVIEGAGTQCKFLWNSSEFTMGLIGVMSRGCRTISYNSNIVDGAYIISKIIEGASSHVRTALSMYMHTMLGWDHSLAMSEVENLKIVIPSKQRQKAIVQGIIHKYKERVLKEQDAERERLGLRSVQQDFEHMLGIPLEFQDSIIEQLREEMEHSDVKGTNLGSLIQYFIYNSEFIMRLINTVGKNFATESMTQEVLDIRQLIQEYCKARSVFYSPCFEMKCSQVFNQEQTFPVMGDKTFLLVMLDAIVENAYRHGFDRTFQQKATKEQKLQFTFEEIVYRGIPAIKICAMNNGFPLEKGFTIDDFIARGRYGKNTGHSGLGGNHIYEIVKRHNGSLRIDTNDEWGMIIEIIIPKYIENGENKRTLA